MFSIVPRLLAPCPGTLLASQAYELKENLLQIANGELNKHRYDSCSSKGEDYYTNGIDSKIVVLIVYGLSLRSKNYSENERVDEVGIVGDSAERDPELHRK